MDSQNKNTDILLVICPMWDIRWPPLGTSYLASYLEDKGIPVDILDINVELYSKSGPKGKELWKMEKFYLWRQENLFEEMIEYFQKDIHHYVHQILKKDYRIVGFSLYGANILFSIKLATMLKKVKPDLFIVFGGPTCSLLRNNTEMPIYHLYSWITNEPLAEPGIVDAFVMGEGEETLFELVSSYLLSNIQPIPGTAFFLDGKYIVSPKRDRIMKLDKIPYPSWEKLPLNLYHFKDNLSLPILFSRGCMNRCTFCIDWKIWQGQYRCRSALNIFEEMKSMAERFNATIFQCNDLLFNGNLKLLEELSGYLIDSNLNISWNAQGLIREDMGPRLLEKLKKSGLYRITYGVESLSDNVLKVMKKRYSFDDIQEVLMNTKKAGIVTAMNIIAGFPTESEEDFNTTKNRLPIIKDYIDAIGALNPCGVMFGSDLETFPERFSINFLKGGLWESLRGTNTFEIRKRRVEELCNLLKSIGIEVEFAGISDENDLSKEIVQIKKEMEGIAAKKKDSIDILLVICPPWGIEIPPLGIASLSTFLRYKGFKTEIFDFNIYLYNKADEKYKYLWEMGSANYWRKEKSFNLLCSLFKKEIDFCVERIISSGTSVLGFSVLSNSQDRITAKIIKQVKEKVPDIKIILGGTSVSVAEQRKLFEEEIPDLVEAYVIGEGEEILYGVLETIKSGKTPEEVPGGLIYQKCRYIYTPQALKENLDEFPVPTFEEFELDAYLNKGKGLIMEWSRGCIGNCSFCAFKAISPKFKKKSPELIVKTIKYYVERYGVEHFSLADSAINGDLKCLEETCDLLIKANFNVKFSCLAIPRRGMSYRLLEKMRKAGFIRIEYGVESGSNKVLKAMKKIYSAEDAENAIRATHKAGITTVIYLIVGYPGEEENELEETIKFLKKNAQYIDLVKSVNPLYLMAGSPIYENYKDYRITLPEADPDFKWFIGKENTYEIRLKRVRKIRSVMNEIGVKYFSEDDMFEREIDLKKIKLKGKVDKRNGLLLVTLPPWGVENPPLGLGYLDSYIRHKGLRCQVYDFNIYFYNSTDAYKMLWHVENKNYWSNEKTFPLICELFKSEIDYAISKILSIDTDLIGFSVVDPKERLTIEVIKRIKDKAPDKKIILGGPACSTEEQRNFFTNNIPGYIDYFVVGEGEETLYEIIQRERNVLNRDNLAGVAIKVDGKWRYTPRQPINLIDTIPFPNYEGFDLSQYNGGRSLLVEWSRGCIGRCSFCKNYSLIPGYRARNPESIIRELDFIINRYGINEFTICDPLMNGDIRQLSMLCDKVIKNGFKIRWSGQIAPRREMDRRLFTKMCKAGCSKIQIGVESGSNKVLRNMRKIYTARIAQENIRAAKRAGMEVEVFIMIGFPGEGEKEFKETHKFIKDNASYIDTIKSINTLHLIAGTDVYEHYKKYNLKPLPERNWHYLWETYDGNNYKARKERAQRLLDLAYDLGLRVMETNIKEGKEELFSDISTIGLLEQLERLKIGINHLQRLPQGETKIRILKKHHPLKFTILGFIFIYTLFYIIHFWIFKKLRGKSLLGGS